MRSDRFFIIVFVASICLSLAPVPFQEVKFVYDGDTILLGSGEKVRYLGIDTPEVDHEGGESEFMAHAAWKFNKKTLKGAQVRLEQDREKRDRYGRLLACVFLKNGKMVNELLVREGLAYVMFKDGESKYKDLLLDSQRKAIKKRKGIWHRKLKGKGKQYLGNRKSFRFHCPDCHFGRKISKNNLVIFKKVRDAFWEGYSPCRQCCP